MYRFFTAPLIAFSLIATPLMAQEELSPMERGAKLFLEGLLEEMAPALREFEGLAEDIGPSLRRFAEDMGPRMGDLLDQVEDWSAYSAPEILPNGDIIIRRKPDATPIDPIDPAPQVEL